jgi:O-antigen/teichoic acid export membrane protein
VLRIDHVLIERLLPNGQYYAGQYAVGYRFIDASNMLGYIFGGLLYPMFSNQIVEKKNVLDLFSFGFKFLFFISLILLSCVLFYLQPILKLLYNDDLTMGNEAIFYQTISIFPLVLINVFGAFILANKLTKEFNVVYLFALCFIIISNILFINIYSIKASAIIFTVGQYIILFGSLYILVKNKKINFKNLLPTHSILIGFMVFFCFYSIYKFMIMGWIFKILLSVSLSLLAVFVSRYIKMSELKNI